MSSLIPRAVFRATRPLRATGVHQGSESAASAASRQSDKQSLQKKAQKDPELFILLAIMSGAFGLVGWHFSRHPTSSSSEQPVNIVKDSAPWQTGDSAAYHYRAEGGNERRRAPSALHEVIIPNVNLPKSLHDRYNKWGKDY